MRDEASDNQRGTHEEPRQRIQMLVTAGRRRRMPAGRPRPIPLNPRRIQKKHARSSEQAESRMTNSRPSPEKHPERDDR